MITYVTKRGLVTYVTKRGIVTYVTKRHTSILSQTSRMLRFSELHTTQEDTLERVYRFQSNTSVGLPWLSPSPYHPILAYIHVPPVPQSSLMSCVTRANQNPCVLSGFYWLITADRRDNHPLTTPHHYLNVGFSWGWLGVKAGFNPGIIQVTAQPVMSGLIVANKLDRSGVVCMVGYGTKGGLGLLGLPGVGLPWTWKAGRSLTLIPRTSTGLWD